MYVYADEIALGPHDSETQSSVHSLHVSELWIEIKKTYFTPKNPVSTR